jgi:(p)ppGpp synthase/HD superfamily hydrolase
MPSIVWSLLVSKAKGRKVSSRFIARSLKKVNLLAEVRGYDEATLQERLKSAYQEYYKIKSNAKELRQTALENLAEAIAASGNMTQEKMLKALREREAKRNQARKIRYLRGKIHTGSTTMVTTQDAQGNKIELTNYPLLPITSEG